MRILFICKFNRFRSKVAEYLTKHYLKRKDVEIKSAGLMIDFMRPFMAKEVVEVLNQRDILVPNQKSELINNQLIKWADKIIIVAGNCPIDKMPMEKIEIWDVRDAFENDRASILMTINEIEEYAQTFAERLNRKK